MMPPNADLAILLGAVAVFSVGALLGLFWRNRQLIKARQRVLELESEMIGNHAEILRLHKILSDSEELNNSGEGNVRVINLHNSASSNVRKHS
ncbi:MAG TPA: hypothetical protein VIK80_04185 [Flavihumibacter sp.]|jgi:hypothetical protein